MPAAARDHPATPAAPADPQALRQLVKIQERERQRLARDLHDTLGQHVAVLRLKLEALQERSGMDVRGAVRELMELANTIDRELDAFGWQLRPPQLQHLGLVRAVSRLVRDWTATCGIAGTFYSRGVSRHLPPDLEDGVYRIAHEALSNVARHAHATHASVTLHQRRRQLVLVVEDDGRGFEWPPAQPAIPSRSVGLRGLFERAELIGGHVEIESAPGGGTTVFVMIPLGT